jgi:hypothetical protein
MELTKSTMNRGKALRGGDSAMSASSDKSGSSFSDSDASDRGRRKDSKRKKAKKTALDRSSKSSGKKKGKDRSSRGSGAKCQFHWQVHFPCSKKILGPELGVECSASGACRHCKKRGHWSGECPIAWVKVSAGLPGYSPRGKRYVGDWDGDRNPTKEQRHGWIFSSQPSTFREGASRHWSTADRALLTSERGSAGPRNERKASRRGISYGVRGSRPPQFFSFCGR